MALIQQSSLNATSSSHSTNQVVVPPQVGLSPTEALGGNQSGNPCVFSCVSKGKLCSWILDLGATDHICCSLIHFSTYTKIAPLNGSNVMAHYAGIVEFSPTLLLTNVLFLPQFTFNLVSVSKLTKSLYCCLIFHSHMCYQVIGLAKLIDGLYYMHFPQMKASTHQGTNLILGPESVSFLVLNREPKVMSFLTYKTLNSMFP